MSEDEYMNEDATETSDITETGEQPAETITEETETETTEEHTEEPKRTETETDTTLWQTGEPITVTITGINLDRQQTGEPIAVIAVAPPRPFLTTPFEDYTVTEGFCLLFFIAMMIGTVHHFLRRFI